MAKRDYYEVLGVSKGASADEVKKAHRKLAAPVPPRHEQEQPLGDRAVQGGPGGVRRALRPGEAQALRPVRPRRPGGRRGRRGGGRARPFEAFRRGAGRGDGRRQRGGPDPNVTVEDFDPSDFGGGNFGDIFEQLFGAAAPPEPQGPAVRRRAALRAQPESQRGADIEHDVTLSFAQAARGTTLPLQIDRDGRPETIEVKIPAGVKDGSRVRIKGRAAVSGGRGGRPLHRHPRRPHPYFRRDGLDILLDVP